MALRRAPGYNPSHPMDLADRNALFPVTRHYAYLNHAALAPLPWPAAERMSDLAATVAATGDRRWPQRNARVGEVRQLVARLIGAPDPAAVAFTENTAAALSMVAEGLPWQAGDNVVTAACEYPANLYPWMNLGRRGVELRTVAERDGRVPAEDLLARVDGRTRVLALSWVQYASGFRSDLARLGAACRERGVLFVVDAIQGLGGLALDVAALPVDVVAAGTQKWLLGPEGLAVLYLAPTALERLRPPRAGARSVRRMFEWDHLELDFNDGALAWECGTLNVYGIDALGAALEILLAVGPAEVERRVLWAADRLAEGLAAAGLAVDSPRRPTERSGIVSVRSARHGAHELVERAAEDGVVVAERGGRVRLSPHFYNDVDDLDRAVAAMGC